MDGPARMDARELLRLAAGDSFERALVAWEKSRALFDRLARLPKETTMSDPTEALRRLMIAAEEAAGPQSKEALEATLGRLWTTEELTADFEVKGFMSPLCVVTRKSDGQKGSLRFSRCANGERYYHSFEEYKP